MQVSSVQPGCSVVSNSETPWTSLLCPSLTPGACSTSYPSSRWYHPTIPYSVIPFSHLQSFPALGSFLMSQFFASGGQNIGAAASAPVFPMNIQDWFPSVLTGLISLQPRGLSRVFSNTTVQKHAGSMGQYKVRAHWSYVYLYKIMFRVRKLTKQIKKNPTPQW